MAALTQAKLKSVLTKSLKLREPVFKLERYGDMLMGHVISESFKGKGDYERVASIRNAVDAAFGVNSNRWVGTLLAYTPEEWDIDLMPPASKRRRQKAS